MRTIKYQGIYRPTGENFEVYKLDILNGIVHGAFDGSESDWCLYSTTPFGYGDAWVREYMGLKDKNGAEIYEGDIVKGRNGATTSESYFIGYVTFESGEIGYKPVRYEGSRPPYMFSKDNILSLKNSELIEVIGNMFQNPELLEVSK